MSIAEEDAFAALGSPNYCFLAAGYSKYGFVCVADEPAPTPRFEVGASLEGNLWGVFAYAGPGQDGKVGPDRNSYCDHAGVYGTSIQFTGVAGTTDGLHPGVYGQCGDVNGLPTGGTAGVLGASRLRPGVWGWSQMDNGVSGESGTATGVWGASSRSYGVLGQTGGFPFGPHFVDPNNPGGRPDERLLPAGVLGTATEAVGVVGTSFKTSGVLGQSGPPPTFDPNLRYAAGVIGLARDARGLIGASETGEGALGTSRKNFGVTGISGAPAPSMPAPYASLRAGVLGSSQDFPGVTGSSRAQVGIFGYSVDSFGVAGVSANSYGIYGEGSKTFAGYFAGSVFVTTSLTATVKNAVVPFPDGSHRLMHCMESPEHWFEDFGSARLADGRATVNLDPDFASVVKAKDYRVFLTPEGDCNGLYVAGKGAAGFEVAELQGGTSAVRFSYRVVGRRKDIKRHVRFAKIEMTRPELPTSPRSGGSAHAATATRSRSPTAGGRRTKRS